MNNRANFVKGMVDENYPYAIEKYDEKPVVFSEIFDEEKTEGAYEQYTTVVSTGTAPKVGEGETMPRRQITEGYTVYCASKKFGEELALTNEAIEDNRKIKKFMQKWSEGLGETYRRTQEDDHADIFNYGGFTAGDTTFLNDISGGVLTTSYGKVCYDSVCFFNDSTNTRSSKSGATYYNGVVTLQLNTTNIETLFNLMTVTNAYDEAGKKVQIIPDTLLVAYGSPNWFLARRIIESPASVDAVHAGIANLWQSQLKVIGWSSLTNASAWFIGCSKMGLKSNNRMPLKTYSYEDQRTRSQIVGWEFRFGKAVSNWRYWVGAGFSQS